MFNEAMQSENEWGLKVNMKRRYCKAILVRAFRTFISALWLDVLRVLVAGKNRNPSKSTPILLPPLDSHNIPTTNQPKKIKIG